MGRCKSAGDCDICHHACLTYDEYACFDFTSMNSMVCLGADPDRTGGVYYPTSCYHEYLTQCLHERLNWLDVEPTWIFSGHVVSYINL